ncbi:MAG: HepT-like ribonuclease domain-containing protein [Coriobacteriia bacterium]|nr:HepT-like ribonuclease domain-containing protein [Coriobacteriia bacterium]
MSGPRDDSLLLDDVVDAAERLISLGSRVPRGWLGQDRDVNEMILWNVVVLGEATKRMREQTRLRFSDVPWELLARTRDRIVHHYEGVDWHIMTLIACDEIPGLLPRLIEIRDTVRTEFDAQEPAR